METTNLFRMVLIFCLLCCFGCSKDDEYVRESGTMEARINGKIVIFESASGYGIFDLDNRCNRNFHQIYGSMEFRASDGHTIYLSFRPSKGIGMYSVSKK